MDKAEYIREAPKWYALGIMIYFRSIRSPATQVEIQTHFKAFDRDENDTYFYLDNDTLFKIASNWLEERGVIQFVRAPFGQPIIRIDASFDFLWTAMSEEGDFPLHLYRMVATGGEIWFRRALQDVNTQWRELEVTPADFETPDREWEPLPLDRGDPALQHTIEKLDDAIEHVRQDNGYAANVPEERELVLQGLSAVSKKLKEEDFDYIRLYTSKWFGKAQINLVSLQASSTRRGGVDGEGGI